MKLIVGLGNPGTNYQKNRHNAGFMAVDYFANKHQLGAFKASTKYQGLKGRVEGGEVLIIKPTTFMNASGEAVKEAASYYKIEPESIVLIYDELAMPFGTIRTRSAGASAGHNGVESVINQIGSSFQRIRVGIANEQSNTTDAAKFVLSDFNALEAGQLDKIYAKVALLLEEFITKDTLGATTLKLA